MTRVMENVEGTDREHSRLVVGCMTGTSLDGLDVAVVRIGGRGLMMRAEVVRGASVSLGRLGPRLRAIAEQQPMTAGEIAELSHEFGGLHAVVIREVLRGERADLVVVHGQTVVHRPPVSWQMVNAAEIAQRVGSQVVFDLRAADLAAGGQGAPITPLADWVLFRGTRPRAIVNLGGFCNVTMLGGSMSVPDGRAGAVAAGRSAEHQNQREWERQIEREVDGIRGFDVCACNHVLDEVARRVLNVPFDRDGQAASAGRVEEGALKELRQLMRAQRESGRSLGTGDEVAGWVGRWAGNTRGEDLCATACRAIAMIVVDAVRGESAKDNACEIVLAGGGVRNRALVNELNTQAGAKVMTSAELGVEIEQREAVCMAVLGALSEDRVPITLPRVTGCHARVVAGTWARPQERP